MLTRRPLSARSIPLRRTAPPTKRNVKSSGGMSKATWGRPVEKAGDQYRAERPERGRDLCHLPAPVPLCREVFVRCSTFLYFSGGRDRTLTMGYSPERRSAVLKRNLPPNNMAKFGSWLRKSRNFCGEHCTSGVLQARGKGQLLPDADARAPKAGLRGTSSTAVLETAAL